jgi:hypothetical protein
MNGMTDPNFQDILDMQVVDIKDPTLLPVGGYVCLVTRQPEFANVGVNNTACVDFNLVPQQAHEDVDQNLLAQALNGAALNTKTIRHRMFVTKDSAYRLKRFLTDDLGIEQTTLRQMISEAMGKQVLVQLRHQASKDGTGRVFINVNKTSKVA